MSTCVFIQIRCKPGKTYSVAEEIALREIHTQTQGCKGVKRRRFRRLWPDEIKRDCISSSNVRPSTYSITM